jgi:hypothetical protein
LRKSVCLLKRAGCYHTPHITPPIDIKCHTRKISPVPTGNATFNMRQTFQPPPLTLENRKQIHPSSPLCTRNGYTTSHTPPTPKPNTSISQPMPTNSTKSKPLISSIRNLGRIASSELANQQIIGKLLDPKTRNHLPNDITAILPNPIFPISSQHHDSEIVHRIISSIHEDCATPSAPPFIFEISQSAADHNIQILRRNDYNLDTVVKSHPTSTCTFGSEFRTTLSLAPILSKHDLWPVVKKTLDTGANMHLSALPEDEQRLAENIEMIKLQNHKSARNNPSTIQDALSKDVTAGFALVIPIDDLPSIPNVMVCPLGMVEQFTISAQGVRTPKRRLTHDQSFSILPYSRSLNDLTDLAKFPDLVYGFCIHRILYQIIALRRSYPNDRILLMKFDFAKAYRRVHYNGKSAMRCISIFKGLAFLQLRLSFGGMGCPAAWCPISEIITDLANDLLGNQAWDPTKCHSPIQTLVPLPTRLQDDIPMHPALPTMVLPDARPFGSADVFIDDIITVFLDTPENCTRAPAAVPLAIHIVGRPKAKLEPIPREPLLSMDKLAAEGAPGEIKIVLGWQIDTRRLLIQLPDDKWLAWTNDITNIIEKRTIPTRQTLEQLIGRLNHAAHVIPLSRFFLGRLRSKLSKATKCRKYRFSIKNSDIDVLSLWRTFLAKANSGISINLLTLRCPTNIIITDACLDGLGGYSISSGRAWRLDLRSFHLKENNRLEFLASVVGVLQAHADNDIPSWGNVLLLTDNSSGLCWLHRNNFNPDQQPIHFEIASKLALTCLQQNFTIHPQHIAGIHNKVADSLSRNHDTPTNTLFHDIVSYFPSQVPANFVIYDLRPEIISWVSSTLALDPSSSTPAQRQPTKVSTAHGDAGASSWSPWTSQATPSLTGSLPPPELRSAEHSCKPFGPGNFPEPETSPLQPDLKALIFQKYWEGVSRKPLSTWRRNFDTISGRARFTSRTDTMSSCPKSAPCSEHGKTWTPQSDENQLLLPNISVSSTTTLYDPTTHLSEPM